MAGCWGLIHLVIGASLLHFVVRAADKTCKRTIPCPTDDCFQLTPCFSGECTEDGVCRCSGCWEGESCNEYNNRYAPIFPERQYDVSVMDEAKGGQHVFTAYAIDGDEELCSDTQHCPCSKVIYGIADGNSANLFSIDADSGHIYVSDGQSLEPYIQYQLRVTANNVQQPGEQNKMVDTTIVRVQLKGNNQQNYESQPVENTLDFMPADLDEGEVHSRRKRAIVYSIPENATFALIKKDKYENVSTIRVGDKISFRLIIQFPLSETDMLVELFTPENETTIMKLCNPTVVHVGSNLEYNNETATPVMDSKDGTTNYDRAIIDLGNVTNNGYDVTNYNASSVFIDYDAVMIDTNETVYQAVYWVSAGAEYNQENEIYVAQASFEATVEELTQARMPNFSMSGPTELALGSSDVFTVDMFISHPSTTVRFDAFAPLNTTSIMSICGVTLKDTGGNYACLPTDSYKAGMSLAENGKGNWHGTLDLGTVVNTGTRDEDNVAENDRITIAFVAHMFDDVNNVNNNFTLGVAVEVGGSVIWAAQMPITAISPSPIPTMIEAPKFVMKTITGTTAYINRPTIIELDMIVPENTISSYLLEVVTPANDSIRFKICRISVIFQGDNVPFCGNGLEAEYYATENSTFTNQAELSLGTIRNSGAKVGNQEANTVRFEIVVQALNASESVYGDTYWVTIGMKFTTNQMWVGRQPYSIEEFAGDEMKTAPALSMHYTFGSDQVHVGDSREFQFEITTAPGATYEPAHIEIIMPDNITEVDNNSTKPLFSICSAKVLFAGKNVPCLNVTSSSLEITYTDRFNTGKRDKAILTLNTLCNIGRNEGNETDNKVILAVVVKVEDHPFLENGTTDWVSAGIIYSNESMWIGQNSVTALRDMIADNANGGIPYLGIERVSNFTNTPIGYVTVFHAFVKLPPRSSMDYTLNVTSKSTALGICGLRLIQYGAYMPCMDTTIVADYIKYPDSRRSTSAAFNLGPITNLGPDDRTVNTSNIFDDDTLLFEITTQLSADSPLITELSLHDIDVVLTSGDGQIFPETEQITATLDTSGINTNTTVESPPGVTFFMVDLNDTNVDNMNFEIGKGAAKRFVLDIIIPESAIGELVVKLFTPMGNGDNDMEVCDLQITYVGGNIPCLDKGSILPSFEPSDDSLVQNIATLDLGYVCHIPILPSTTDANTITVEGVMLVDRDTQLTEVNVTSSVRISDIFIVLTDLPLTIVENVTESMYVNNTNSTFPNLFININDTTMTIGQVLTFPIAVHIPPYTTARAYVDVHLPVNESAELTVQAIRFVSAGSNLACLNDREEYKIEFISNRNTSQNDKGYIDFGLVNNAGMSYRTDKYNETDDQLIIEFDIQMADSILNEHDTLHQISFAVEYSGIIVLVYRDIQVKRDDNERPRLEILAESNYTESFGRSDTLVIDAQLKHLNTSTAEGVNVTATFYLPPFVTALSINYSSLEAEADFADGSMIRVEFPRLYFTDVVSFGVLLQVLSNASTPVSIVDAITPYEAGATMYYRTNTVFGEGEFFMTELLHVSYKVTAYSASDCLLALGMQDMRIRDCQISGSLAPNPARLPKHGRRGGSGWSPFQRGDKFAEHRYFQVYFGNITRVTKIAIEHPAAFATDRVTQLQIYYSDDGKAWSPGDKLNPSPGYTDVELPIFTPRDSRYIRLYILSNTGAAGTALVGLTFEFYGCAMSDDIIDACAIPGDSPAPEFTGRSFLYDNTKVYVCDADPGRELTMRCFSSVDGDTWKVLDETIGNVIGYSPVTQELFGLDVDKMSYMSSIDGGETWDCTLPSTWADVQAHAGFVQAVEVPWTQDAGLTGPNPAGPFISNMWGATAAGLYYNSGSWKMRLDWESCCL